MEANGGQGRRTCQKGFENKEFDVGHIPLKCSQIALPVHRKQASAMGKAEEPKQQVQQEQESQEPGASGPGEKSASQRRKQKLLKPLLSMQSVPAGVCGFRIDQGIILTPRAHSLGKRHIYKFMRGKRISGE